MLPTVSSIIIFMTRTLALQKLICFKPIKHGRFSVSAPTDERVVVSIVFSMFFFLIYDLLNGFIMDSLCVSVVLLMHLMATGKLNRWFKPGARWRAQGEAHTRSQAALYLNAAAPNCWMFYATARLLKLLWVINPKQLDVRLLRYPHWWMSAFYYRPVEKVDPWTLHARLISPVQDCLALQIQEDPGQSWSRS